jgi:hypothetical protein
MAFEKRRYTVVGGRADVWAFLADLVAIVTDVLTSSVTGLGRPSGSRDKGSNGCEVLVYGFDGLDSEGASGYGTVNNDRFPDSEPVLNMSGGASLSPLVDFFIDFTDKKIAIGGENVVAFLMEVSEMDGSETDA